MACFLFHFVRPTRASLWLLPIWPSVLICPNRVFSSSFVPSSDKAIACRPKQWSLFFSPEWMFTLMPDPSLLWNSKLLMIRDHTVLDFLSIPLPPHACVVSISTSLLSHSTLVDWKSGYFLPFATLSFCFNRTSLKLSFPPLTPSCVGDPHEGPLYWDITLRHETS